MRSNGDVSRELEFDQNVLIIGKGQVSGFHFPIQEFGTVAKFFGLHGHGDVCEIPPRKGHHIRRNVD